MMDDFNTQEETVSGNGQACAQEDSHISYALRECQQQVGEWKDKYIRLTADLDNLNRRAAKDRALSLHTAQVALLTPLLSIVDDFERALETKMGDTPGDIRGWIEGISMIHSSLVKYLQSVGVEPMKSYDHFDPERHEALVSVEAEGKEPDSIVAILQKGYLLKGEVLRHAKVSVVR
jgi:molecular chaperone GrpE